MDQTLSHFKRQREDHPGKQPSTREIEQKPEEVYEPSANFYKVFSQIMGEKLKASKNVKLNEKPKFNNHNLTGETPHKSKEDEAEHIKQNSNKKHETSQTIRKTVEPEQKEENTSKLAKPSVFERLSHRDTVS